MDRNKKPYLFVTHGSQSSNLRGPIAPSYILSNAISTVTAKRMSARKETGDVAVVLQTSYSVVSRAANGRIKGTLTTLISSLRDCIYTKVLQRDQEGSAPCILKLAFFFCQFSHTTRLPVMATIDL